VSSGILLEAPLSATLFSRALKEEARAESLATKGSVTNEYNIKSAGSERAPMELVADTSAL
jgi:hypothetical protein